MSQIQNEDLNLYITEDSVRTNSSGLTNAMSGILRNRLSKRPRHTIKGDGADYDRLIRNGDDDRNKRYFDRNPKPTEKF